MANEAAGSAHIVVGGASYGNFLRLVFKRVKAEATCSGTITLSWPGAEMLTATSEPVSEITDGVRGTLILDGQLAATFRVDNRTSKGGENGYTLDINFRGLASSIVDSHADHPSGQENKKSPAQISKKLMEGYEPKLVDKSNENRQLERFIIQEGESVERAMRRCCREFGLTFTENEKGDVELTKKGQPTGGMGQPLILGRNFYQWSVKKDMAPRFQKIKAKGNSVPTDKKYGKEAEELVGESQDQAVKYKRELHMLIDSDHDKQTLKKRALTEANRRKGAGLEAELVMSTWSDDGGQLWKVGNLHFVSIPVDGVNDLLEVSQVVFEIDKDERKATVTLVPKETFDDSEGGGGDDGSGAGGGGGAFSSGGISSGGGA